MISQTNIPETTLCFDGRIVDFRDHTSDGVSLNHRTSQLQATLSGNRCGHDPRAPRFYLRPAPHKYRPSFLEEAIERVKTFLTRSKKKAILKKILALNPSCRLKRSERREAIASILQTLLHYLELETLRVGFFDENHIFKSLDLTYIAKIAGVSFSRAKRAIADLVKADYLTLSRRCEQREDGTFTGKASIREIKISFFIDLGMDMPRLAHQREQKCVRNAKAAKKILSEQAKSVLKMAIQLTGSKAVTPGTKGEFKPKDSDRNVAKKKALAAETLALYRADPSRSIMDYYVALQRQLE